MLSELTWIYTTPGPNVTDRDGEQQATDEDVSLQKNDKNSLQALTEQNFVVEYSMDAQAYTGRYR